MSSLMHDTFLTNCNSADAMSSVIGFSRKSSMSAPSGSADVGVRTVSREGRAPHLLTPSTGIYARSHQSEVLQHCDDCGSAIRNTGTWNRPRYVCGNYSCPKCPFQRERVNTSFSVVEG